ncbi:MAG: DUF917 family protein [Cyclonatronaceae bacterium]
MILDHKILDYALLGGAILGGGGGASMEMGKAAGEAALALGRVDLIPVDDLPPQALVVTASLVGSPASNAWHVRTDDYVRAVMLLQEHLEQPLDGIITNENGGGATINGWIQSAALGIPLVDAPCNGRAHPTGTMGGMGLHRQDGFLSLQTYAGGNPNTGRRLEGYIKGSLQSASAMVRRAAVQAGGLVAVARNPVPADHVRRHGALNGITHAIETGRVFRDALSSGPEHAVARVAAFLGGDILTAGTVTDLQLVTEDGFDTGSLRIDDTTVTFWNEYMTAVKAGQRAYTFPDLIMTFDRESGLPVTSAEIREGQSILLLGTGKNNLKLGSTMHDPELLKPVEKAVATADTSNGNITGDPHHTD